MSTNKISTTEKGNSMKQALCLVAAFLLLTAAKDGVVDGTANSMAKPSSYTSKTMQPAAGNDAALPDASTLALLSDPGFQSLFGKGGIFDGSKEDVDKRISAIETMMKMGPALQDPNFVASMQAMAGNPPPANGAAATSASRKRAAY